MKMLYNQPEPEEEKIEFNTKWFTLDAAQVIHMNTTLTTLDSIQFTNSGTYYYQTDDPNSIRIEEVYTR